MWLTLSIELVFKVYLGGGRNQFLPTLKKNSIGEDGLRNDGRNLIDEWLAGRSNAGKAVYVDNKVVAHSLMLLLLQ